jgi:hypothetical protein
MECILLQIKNNFLDYSRGDIGRRGGCAIIRYSFSKKSPGILQCAGRITKIGKEHFMLIQPKNIQGLSGFGSPNLHLRPVFNCSKQGTLNCKKSIGILLSRERDEGGFGNLARNEKYLKKGPLKR